MEADAGLPTVSTGQCNDDCVAEAECGRGQGGVMHVDWREVLEMADVLS